MLRNMLYAKIHRLTGTEADLDYVGSVTVDRNLREAARLGFVTSRTSRGQR